VIVQLQTRGAHLGRLLVKQLVRSCLGEWPVTSECMQYKRLAHGATPPAVKTTAGRLYSPDDHLENACSILQEDQKVAKDGASPAVVGLAAAVTHDTPVAALLASSIAMHSNGPKVWVLSLVVCGIALTARFHAVNGCLKQLDKTSDSVLATLLTLVHSAGGRAAAYAAELCPCGGTPCQAAAVRRGVDARCCCVDTGEFGCIWLRCQGCASPGVVSDT
jgi:hypothetical protein